MADVRIALRELLRKYQGDHEVDALKEGLVLLVQELMEAEVKEKTGAERYERTKSRRTYRNGYRPRRWDTRVGSVTLRIPKVRQGSYFPALLEPRRRTEKALLSVVQEAYVHGVSTRKVDDLVAGVLRQPGEERPQLPIRLRRRRGRGKRNEGPVVIQKQQAVLRRRVLGDQPIDLLSLQGSRSTLGRTARRELGQEVGRPLLHRVAAHPLVHSLHPVHPLGLGHLERVANRPRHPRHIVRVHEQRLAQLLRRPGELAQDKMDRELILETLQEKLAHGAKALVGNRGFRRYLRVEKDAVRVDRRKVEEEARYDGKWVLRTNTALPAGEVALQYKRLLTGERFFREAKGLLETRPIFHEYQATIAGHIFVSFLALAVRHELCARLRKKGHALEWGDVVRDLAEVREVEVRHRGKDYVLRPPLKGVAGKVFGAAGVAVPPPVRQPLPPGAKA